MAIRDKLHRLVELLPDSELVAAERYLEFLDMARRDPVLAAFLNAPDDDEPLTPDDEAAIAEGHQAVARGEIDSWKKVRARYLGQD